MSEPEDDINNNPQVHSKNNRRIDTRRVENRLIQLESRLEKAREARDQYLDFMKSKYPEWQPPKIITYRSRSSGPPRARPNYHNRPKFYEDDLHRGKNFYPRGYYEDHHPSPQRPPPVRSSLLGRLETSQYFWNNSTSQQARQPEPWRANFLAVNEPIPS
uniref:Uncharacterized protein n=1 Tax=Acrobeloides nanus TaxID=290746 RepID=A0A914D8A5_9BILA